MDDEIWTLLKLLQWTSGYFQKNQIENPRLNVEYLLGKLTGLDRVELYLNYDRMMTKNELDDFKALIKRRVKGEPLQYILGETSFYGYPIRVNPNVLIPRPETELLVEKVIADLAGIDPGVIADIGTGSGCIAIALAKELPGWEIIATDISKDALQLAQKNAERNSVDAQIRFIEADARKQMLPPLNNLKAIVSNPPYVSVDEYQTLPVEVKSYEPPHALHDGNDGLSFYQSILDQAPALFGNHSGLLYFELGYQSLSGVLEHISAMKKNIQTEVIADYAGIDRILKVNFNE